MKHFAYGSNMDLKDIKKWCDEENNGQQIILSNGKKYKLKNYKIAFTRKSKSERRYYMGVSDIIYCPGDFCWGVVFDISEEDLKILDKKEGVRKNKKGEDIGAYVRFDDLPNGMITYKVRDREPDFVQPHNDYVNHIITGAKKYGLPQSWIDKLELFKKID